MAANKHYYINALATFYITTNLWDVPYNIIPHAHLTLLIPLISILHTLLMFSSINCLLLNKLLFLNSSWCVSHICHGRRARLGQQLQLSLPICIWMMICPIPKTVIIGIE